ncbi:VOC family protein [Streptomyces hygroscopicus]|uniref:VOC family protein n=1 Tax=Streptomyces hygroscopicus TaxID=1912 RepID=UPI00076706EA|nr:VOC family protein [Streptomyces hygroscopicus]GLV79467.1 glyoxalase [Streptomyces hygroscopicus subsp. hygroscopicus]
MPEVTSYQPGTPCWIDLMVPDQRAALDFYAGLFGWEAEIGPPETGGYAMCTLRGKPVAGVMSAAAMGDETPPPTVWTTYFCSADAQATSEAVSRAGGTVLLPVMDVMDLGRMLVAADPLGAVFGVWQPLAFPGVGLANEPGTLIWNELNTTDREAASAFYAEALGLESTPVGDAAGYFELSVDGRTVGGLQPLREGLPPEVPPHWLVYFAVEKADRSTAKVSAEGGTVLRPPYDMVAGRMAVVRDPQGAPFALIAPKSMG